MIFSERYKLKPEQAFQKENMNQSLKVNIWHITYENYFFKLDEYQQTAKESITIELIWTKIFKFDINKIPNYYDASISRTFRKTFYQLKWYEVYDLIEIILKYENNTKKYIESLNRSFEENNNLYRILNNKIVPITNDIEIKSIKDNFKNPYDPVKKHIQKSLNHLSNRENPDYANSYKESINAVESLCNVILVEKGYKKKKVKNYPLGKSLNIIFNSTENEFDKSLKACFSTFYGHASNYKGIRHGQETEEEVSYDEAKVTLIICSAFINYLQTSILEN